VSRIGRRAGKTVSLGVYAIWKAFTTPNTRVLIITPYESQVKLIFDDTIRPLIADSPMIRNSIVKDRSQPFWIEFSHGSAILGMTAGTRSGQHGTSIRGQTANVVILDEADFLTPQSHAAIDAIFHENEKVEMWASSTPTGKREWFYNVCTDRRLGYKEFHYPSMVSPTWNPEFEQEARLTITEEEFEHEYLADWGSQAQGVFNPIYVDQCVVDYSYDELDIRKVPGNIRVMGVDWNAAKNGIQIVIVEFCMEPIHINFKITLENDDLEAEPEVETIRQEVKDKFVVLRRLQITDKEMTQAKGINAILKLMAEYDVDHLYVDEGYGHTNVEDLYNSADDYPQLRIKDKLKPVNLSGKIQIRDPQTRKIEEKPLKPYMVNNSKLRVEQLSCILPQHEDYPTGIVGQMRNYLVVRISDKGYPTYSSENDHALDAWMIAMLGFAEEYSELKGSDAVRFLRAVKAEAMRTLHTDYTRALEGNFTEVTRHPINSAKIEKAIAAAGLSDDHIYAGWDTTLHDDSDAAIERRRQVNRNVRTHKRTTLPWGGGKRRNAFASPRRTNINPSRAETPWSR
jgi:hypothetical protein